MNGYEDKQPKKMEVVEQLEENATAIATQIGRRGESSPAITLARDIALTLEHIDRVRALHRGIEESLGKSRCVVGTELLRFNHLHSYELTLDPERVSLLGKLLAIESEHRRHELAKRDQIRQLHDRLSSLLNQYTQLIQNHER